MTAPTIRAGEYASGRKQWKTKFEDRFQGRQLDAENWNIEVMDDPLNRAGNEGMNESGEIITTPHASVGNKRWSAWYHQHHSKTIIVNNGLTMACHITNEEDRTRRAFDQFGLLKNNHPLRQEAGKYPIYRPDEHRCYLGWLTTRQRIWNEVEKQHVTKPGQAGHTFRYGAFELVVNFTRMIAEGVRLSAWLTAAHDENGKDCTSNMYNGNPADGLECDFFEHEGYRPFANSLMMKNLSGGKTGDTPKGRIDLSNFGIDLFDGKDHVITHFWEPDGHHWYCDGVRTQKDLDRVMQVFATMEITREANSAVVSKGRNIALPEADPPHLPYDAGLYHTNVWSNINEARKSAGVIKRVSVWEDQPSKRQVNGAQLRQHGMADRKIEISQKTKLTWETSDSESRWNVYRNGKYLTTVHEPHLDISDKGDYTVQGLSDISKPVSL